MQVLIYFSKIKISWMILIPGLNTKSRIAVLLKVKIIQNEKEIRILCPKKYFS